MCTTTHTMAYRRFGRTGLDMPVFSCGGMRYQQSWDEKGQDIESDGQDNLEATICRALELGINHIETARGYGTSERQLGRILPTLPREKMIIQTKIGPEADAQKFTDNFHDSLDRLKLDKVDLLSIHGINNDQTLDHSIKPGGCFEAAQKIRESGLADYIGFSTHGPVDVIVKAVEFGQPETGAGFDYVNLHWYYIFQRNWPAIREATRRDMGVFIISPSDKGGMLYKPTPKFVELTQPLHPITFNDLYCLFQPEVHTLSVGAARPSDFDEHVAALPYLDRAGETLAPIVALLEKTWNDAVPTALRDPHHAGLPENDHTPGNINLPIILWLLLLTKVYDMTEYAKMRYNLLGNGGHWFPGLKADQLDNDGVEDQLRALIADHPLGADAIIDLLREAHSLLHAEEQKRLSESE